MRTYHQESYVSDDYTAEEFKNGLEHPYWPPFDKVVFLGHDALNGTIKLDKGSEDAPEVEAA